MSLNIKNLSIRIGNDWVLRDVEFEAKRGRIFGICGASGSGKTTLLRAIAGELAASGEVSLDGQDITKLGKNRDLELLTERRAGFRSLFGDPDKDLSAGRTQESEFRRAISTARSVILLDEPFIRLDRCSRAELEGSLKTWLAPDKIAVIASSSFESLAPLADRILLLGDGYSKQTGSPKDLYEHPGSRIVAELTGDTNLIRARRVSSSDAALPEFQTLDGDFRIFAQPTPKNRLGPLNKDCTLSIRPEQITMSMGASFPEDNLLRAVVKDIEFHGATSLITYDAGGLRLRSRVFKTVDLEPGTECMLGLPTDRIVVLGD